MSALYLATHLRHLGFLLIETGMALIILDWVRMEWRAHRNRKQVATDMALRAGFKKAGRLGWVKEIDDSQINRSN